VAGLFVETVAFACVGVGDAWAWIGAIVGTEDWLAGAVGGSAIESLPHAMKAVPAMMAAAVVNAMAVFRICIWVLVLLVEFGLVSGAKPFSLNHGHVGFLAYDTVVAGRRFDSWFSNILA